jgi:hypothetical protein
MADSDTRALERLLQDPEFRARFRRDPAAAAREEGLDGLANELELGDPMQTLEPRESRSSLAGVLMAGVLEGVGIYEGGQHLLPPVDEAYAASSASTESNGWAFVRAGGSFPGNHPDYTQLRGYGASGVLWDPDDPTTAAGIASSHGAGLAAGLWLVPHQNESPQAFAQRAADAISRYHPDKVVLDIEAIGKGYAGSSGWRWSEDMMNAFSRLQPNPPPLAVTVEPLQDDFNYAAYSKRGAEVWPQSYLGDMTPRDPQEVVDRVVSNGVPRNLVVPVLGPKQLDAYNGPHQIYTADDIQGRTPSTSPAVAGLDSPNAGGLHTAVTPEQVAADRATRDAVRAAESPRAPTPTGGAPPSAPAPSPASAPSPDPAPTDAAASPGPVPSPVSSAVQSPVDPDDLQGNLDDEDAGADEEDGSNDDEPDEGGSDDDSGDSASDDNDEGSDDEASDDASDDEGEGGSDDDQDAPGEGSNGEDANDPSSDGDSSDGDDSDSDDSGDTSGDSSGDNSPDDGATPDLQGVDSAYPGDNAPREQVAAWMASAAQKRGLPPELPVMASVTESGLRNLNYGDADSVGFFQMRVSIWNQGAYSGYADKPERQLDWFLDHAEAVKKQRLARGLPVDDPKQYGEWIADVENPAAQYRGRYQANLAQARNLLAQATPKSSGNDQALQVVDAASGSAEGKINELFYDPLGGVKYGKQIGAIGGHVDHVHMSLDNGKAQLRAIQQAQKMGLHVSDDGVHDKVDPVHVRSSFHYRTFGPKFGNLRQAADVSGSPQQMAAFYRWVSQTFK